jgi:23S rRNA G2069 N7-methylase RlmK/C1962 C5-methylase RlmI
MVNTLAKEEGRGLKVCSILTQSNDHPVDPSFPESRYLSGLLLEVE